MLNYPLQRIERKEVKNVVKIIFYFLGILPFVYFYYLLVFQNLYTQLDSSSVPFTGVNAVDLGVHEMSHYILFTPLIFNQSWPYGLFLHILGGTLVQWLFPTIFSLAFLRKGYYFLAFACVFWIGESIMFSVPYIADGKAMQLPLVTGNIHDWNYLLTFFHLIDHAAIIAQVFKVIAILSLSAGLLGMIGIFVRSILQKEKQKERSIY